MMRFITSVLAILLISGCADHALQNRGSESVAYQEQHRFEFSFHSQSEQFDLQQVNSLVEQFDLRKARFTVQYPSVYEKQASDLVGHLKEMKIRPDWITNEALDKGDSVVLIVSQWQSVIEYCKPVTITLAMPQAGCSVKTNHTIQLVNPGARVN
ncbi:hypothetical protein [Vibrio rarus]|uniref:hypothetical protein n=1 Tax=Vibrio rarus TaxID=413403 RepID=UPI0021C3F83E|nr:hypothetical protein [Vibrio rarus]